MWGWGGRGTLFNPVQFASFIPSYNSPEVFHMHRVQPGHSDLLRKGTSQGTRRGNEATQSVRSPHNQGWLLPSTTCFWLWDLAQATSFPWASWTSYSNYSSVSIVMAIMRSKWDGRSKYLTFSIWWFSVTFSTYVPPRTGEQVLCWRKQGQEPFQIAHSPREKGTLWKRGDCTQHAGEMGLTSVTFLKGS